MARRTVLSVLEDAYEIIRDKKRWTTGALYNAGAYCALGAVSKAAGKDPAKNHVVNWMGRGVGVRATQMLASAGPRDLQDSSPRDVIWRTNDTRGRARTLAMFRKAIRKAKELEAKGTPA